MLGVASGTSILVYREVMSDNNATRGNYAAPSANRPPTPA